MTNRPAPNRPDRPPTLRDQQKAATREKLLAEARRQFRAQGYAPVTIRGVAAAAGVSTGAIFANFRDKADLYYAAMGLQAPELHGFLDRVAALAGQAGVLSDLAIEALGLKAQLTGKL